MSGSEDIKTAGPIAKPTYRPPKIMLWLCLPWLASVVAAALVLGEWVDWGAEVGWVAFWVALVYGGLLMVSAVVLGLRRNPGNLLIVLALPIISTAAGHWATPPAPLQEIQRAPNPSGTLDAVVMQVEAGGPGHVPSLVFVTPKGVDPNPRQPVYRATRIEALGLRWAGDQALVIQQQAGKVFDKKTAARVGKARVSIRYE